MPDQLGATNMINREQWLNKLATIMNRELFNNSTPKYRVTCGFPSKGGLASTNKVIGQCFPDSVSGDSTHEMIISMTIDNDIEVAATLAHEMIHATVGLDKGHLKPFRDLALQVGLTGKMTATKAGDKFINFVSPYLKVIGKYPHSKIKYKNDKKQTTRLIKCECKICGYIVRVTRTWLDKEGSPHCPLHGSMDNEYLDGDDQKSSFGKWILITPESPSFKQSVLACSYTNEVELIKNWVYEAYGDGLYTHWMPEPKSIGKSNG